MVTVDPQHMLCGAGPSTLCGYAAPVSMDGMAVDTEVGMAVDMSQCEHFASGPLSPDERWEPWDKYMDERISQEVRAE